MSDWLAECESIGGYLKPGGLLCGHDGVEEAISGFSPEIVDDTTIWVRR